MIKVLSNRLLANTTLPSWFANTLSFLVGISATDSPAHVNLAAELIPIEYRWATLCSGFWPRSAASPARVRTRDTSWPHRFREKFIRLQHENKMLRVQQEEHQEEKITALQTQLEESHKTRSELDTENRWVESPAGQRWNVNHLKKSS